MAKIIRKPVPQLSTCRKCGNDFKYLRTMRARWYCDNCNEEKDDDWRDQRKLRLDLKKA